MERSDVVSLMNNRNVTPDEMYQFSQRYHREVKKVEWSPQRVDIFQLEHLLNLILEEASRVFHIYILRDKKGNVIKIY